MATGLQYNVSRYFFDRDVVQKAVDGATLRVLSFAGGLTRIIARRSLRKRKKPSAPGSPPSSHTGELREGIVYAYDPARKSVVIGPRKFNKIALVGGKWSAGTVPQILEEGGRIGVHEQQILAGGDWHRVDKRRRQNNNVKRIRTANIEPRPYMAPALEKARPQFAAKWKDSIR